MLGENLMEGAWFWKAPIGHSGNMVEVGYMIKSRISHVIYILHLDICTICEHILYSHCAHKTMQKRKPPRNPPTHIRFRISAYAYPLTHIRYASRPLTRISALVDTG